jgi:hypothetical protein
LGQESCLNKNNGLRVRAVLRLLKDGHREHDAAFVRYPSLPFLAGDGKTLATIIDIAGADMDII